MLSLWDKNILTAEALIKLALMKSKPWAESCSPAAGQKTSQTAFQSKIRPEKKGQQIECTKSEAGLAVSELNALVGVSDDLQHLVRGWGSWVLLLVRVYHRSSRD